MHKKKDIVDFADKVPIFSLIFENGLSAPCLII